MDNPLHSKKRSIRSSLTFWIQWVTGLGASILLLLLMVSHSFGAEPFPYRILAVLILLVSVPVYASLRVYLRTHSFLSGLARLILAWSGLMGVSWTLAVVTESYQLYDVRLLLKWAVGSLVIQSGCFMVLHYIAQQLYKQIRSRRRACIVGIDESIEAMARTLIKDRHEPIIGFIQGDDELPMRLGLPCLGQVSALDHILEIHNIKRVYLILPFESVEEVESLYIELMDANVDVVWIPSFRRKLVLLNKSIRDVGGVPAFHLNESPLTADPTGGFIKAIMDRSLSLAGIILLSPLLILIAILVKFSSPGPVLFKQRRHGWNGEVIDVLKFRSMKMHDDSNVEQATRIDPRVTPIGRFIRKTSIDELPQLFNVLRGDMSLVGPRPHATKHNDYYSQKINAYMARHRVKPGITGLAQISGARGETDTLEKMEKRVRLDLEYINNWSIWLDIKILIKTPFTLFSKDIY